MGGTGIGGCGWHWDLGEWAGIRRGGILMGGAGFRWVGLDLGGCVCGC